MTESSIAIAPIPEQRRIVAKIEELFTQLDAGVEALRKVQAQLKRYRQSALKAAVEGRLTAEWREAHRGELEPASVLLARIRVERRAKWEAEQLAKMEAQGKPPKDDTWKAKYVEPPAPDTSDLPELPEGWEWTQLGNLSVVITKGESPKWQGYDYVDEGIPFIRSENVLNGYVEYDTVANVTEAFHIKLSRSQIKDGDVLVNLVGASIGRCAVVPPVLEKGNINQAVGLVRLYDSVLPLYLMYLLLSPEFQMHIQAEKVETARANISLGDLRELRIPVPSTFEQQTIIEEIERCLSVASQIEKSIERSLQQAQRLRQSILKKAFEGRLVPQNPDDEPAERLLERIKAAKAGPSTNGATNTRI